MHTVYMVILWAFSFKFKTQKNFSFWSAYVRVGMTEKLNFIVGLRHPSLMFRAKNFILLNIALLKEKTSQMSIVNLWLLSLWHLKDFSWMCVCYGPLIYLPQMYKYMHLTYLLNPQAEIYDNQRCEVFTYQYHNSRGTWLKNGIHLIFRK